MHAPHFSFQTRLITGFAGICLLIGLLSLGVGTSIINRTVFNEAANRISQDLNSAWEIFTEPLKRTYPAFELTASDEWIRSAIREGRDDEVVARLKELREILALDFVSLLLPGDPSTRIGSDGTIAPAESIENTFIETSVVRKVPLSGVEILSQPFLMAEDPRLAEQARVSIVPTPHAEPRPDTEEVRALAMVTSFPIILGGKVRAVLYGGVILNKNNAVVDRIRDTVFRFETYNGINIGTATVFFNDLRIATNVTSGSGDRAIGTQVSKEVKASVLLNGKRWSDRAFVVNNWYKTAYDPIEDTEGNRIGMLYVGVLEAKYVDFRREALKLYILIIIGGLCAAILLGYLLSRYLLSPINFLIDASRRVSEGQLDPDIGRVARSEIGVLQKMFVTMLVSFQERVQQQEDDSTVKLLQSEKQASVGRLAAGVAHEINNPLTSVLTFTHLLMERDDLPDDVMSDLSVISENTDRVRKIVRGLLDFSRHEELHQVPTDVNELIESTIALVGSQIRRGARQLAFEPASGVPLVTIDRSQIQGVLINLLLNASDACEERGSIAVSTEISVSSDHPGKRGVEISVQDTGVGIPPDHLERLFDPFFTTKQAGQGTGLGLAVSRNVIDGHGGTIRVRSSEGAGSIFTVWLPLDPV
jgi:two-component system, NtrC family, sensor kinase